MEIAATRRRDASRDVPGGPAQPCRFCDIVAGRASRWPDRVLLETESYVVVASIGALVPGWAMVVPREHKLNLAAAVVDSEFCWLRLRVSAMLRKAFPAARVRLFEHGSQAEGSLVGCGVDHAHLHLVPLRRSLEPWIRMYASEGGWYRLALKDMATVVSGQEYLLYSDDAASSNPRCLLSLPAKPSSQFFRRAVASEQEQPDYFDYRTYPFFENVAATQTSLTHFSVTMGARPHEGETTGQASAVDGS